MLGVAGSRDLRWAAVDLTGAAEEARWRHDLSPVAAAALGRALAGAALLQRMSVRACRRVTLTVAGDGPLGRVIAEADDEGGVRGWVANPAADTPEGAGGKIGAAVGTGTLRVVRVLRDGSLWESQVALHTGEIGLDLAHFLEQSDQVHSAVLLGVLEGPEGIRAAGGMIIEALPGAAEATLAQLESNLSAVGPMSRRLAADGLDRLVAAVLAGLGPEAVERSEVRFRCSCARESLLPHLTGLGAEERLALADEHGLILAECAFCGARYLFGAGELDPQ